MGFERRKVLALAGFLMTSSGCLSGLSDRSPTGTPTEATPTKQETQTEHCILRHCVSKADKDDTPHIHDEFKFEDLSELAQKVFLKALQQDDCYDYRYDGGNAPPEFEYSTERNNYLITYESSQYILFAFTDPGCTVN